MLALQELIASDGLHSRYSVEEIRQRFSREQIVEMARQVVALQQALRQERALLLYQPVSAEARRFHLSTAQQRIILGGNGCLPLMAPILMADGSWSPLQDVKVGDFVIAVDSQRHGTPAKVVSTFRSGTREVFCITFSDGGNLYATLDHMIPMYVGPGRKTSKGYLQVPRKRKLADYAHRFEQHRADNRLSALSPASVQFSATVDKPLDPYLLGLLLGDGNLTNGCIRFSSIDERVISRLKSIVEPEFILRQDKGPNLRIVRKGRGSLSHPMIRDLGLLGLWGCDSRKKFIPHAYLSGSIAEREELLCGLIDTDGTVDSFCSVSKYLVDGFTFLVRSLGGKATIKEHCNNFGSFWLVYWRIDRNLPLSIPEKHPAPSKKPIDYTRRIIRKIESVGMMPTGDIEVDHPDHCYVACDWVVVSNSSKTESNLADMVIRMTGMIPESLKADYPREVLRPPISARLIVESLTNTWEQSIKPKLIWNHWTGLADGKHGHWGWIPKEFLIKGKWDESWSEKFRTLTLTNGSTLHVMSGDQDVTDFASASVHDIRVDEGKKHSLWRENVMRLREGGSIAMAMTPPDDESASWDAAWVYDALYEKGMAGPGKDPDIDSFTLFTENNPYIAPDFMSKVGKNLTPEQREVRFHGRFMHLGGRIYANFTEREQAWCFSCNKICFAVQGEKKLCGTCAGGDVVDFCHVVEPFERAYKWPCIFIVDPHPRKPVMCAWVVIDPADDWWQVAELQVDGTPEDIRNQVNELEKRFDLFIAKRIIDPNMAESQAHNAGRRHITVRDEYDAVGLRCALADDNFHTGKDRIKNMLKPDPKTRRPRLHIFRTCRTAIQQFQKFSWDEWARFTSDVRDPKAKPKDKDNDYPVMMGYLANDNPTYAGYHRGYSVNRPKSKRVGAY